MMVTFVWKDVIAKHVLTDISRFKQHKDCKVKDLNILEKIMHKAIMMKKTLVKIL